MNHFLKLTIWLVCSALCPAYAYNGASVGDLLVPELQISLSSALSSLSSSPPFQAPPLPYWPETPETPIHPHSPETPIHPHSPESSGHPRSPESSGHPHSSESLGHHRSSESLGHHRSPESSARSLFSFLPGRASLWHLVASAPSGRIESTPLQLALDTTGSPAALQRLFYTASQRRRIDYIRAGGTDAPPPTLPAEPVEPVEPIEPVQPVAVTKITPRKPVRKPVRSRGVISRKGRVIHSWK